MAPPHAKGCTYTALSVVAGQLEKHGISTHMIHVGHKPIHGCIACGKCAETRRCVFNDDPVNETIELLLKADGLVVGSPVYYGGPNGILCSFLDRIFFTRNELFAFKPAAAVVSCRRGGASAAFDRLNKYFTISRMPVYPPSTGIPCTAGSRKTSCRTGKDSRPCAPSATIWPGCWNVLRPAVLPASPLPP